MIDDVTRRIITREANSLGPLLYDHLDIAIAATRSTLKVSEWKYPHLHSAHRRAILREGLEIAELPGGWQVSGNSRFNGQLILSEPTLGASLRFLADSYSNTDGIPHAGHTIARQRAWTDVSVPLFHMRDLAPEHRDLLLLINARSSEPSMRIVHPLAPGRFSGTVPCDFQIKLARDTAEMADSPFAGSDEYENLFDLELDLGEEDGV